MSAALAVWTAVGRYAAFWCLANFTAAAAMVGAWSSLNYPVASKRAKGLTIDVLVAAGMAWIFSLAWRSL